MSSAIIKLAVILIPFIILFSSLAISRLFVRRNSRYPPCRVSSAARHISGAGVRRDAALIQQHIQERNLPMFHIHTKLSALALTCALLTGGCAMTERENRLTLNALDEALEGSAITNSASGRIAAAPLAIPVGTMAGVVDMVVVTPARAVAPAWKDTNEMIWLNPRGSEMRQAMLFMPKVVATPLLFMGDWVGKSMFATKF